MTEISWFIRDSARAAYNAVTPLFTRLADSIDRELVNLLNKNKIDYHNISKRIKDFDSFHKKLISKGYIDPLVQTEDICGLRIICYYPTDMDRIGEIIREEFNVLESINKSTLLEPDRFGYRSDHYIVSLKDEWLGTPTNRELAGLKAEIQVRTILMHGWAEIEHKVAYKQEEEIPTKVMRKFCQLSALLEIADDLFEQVKNEREALLRPMMEEPQKIIDSVSELSRAGVAMDIDVYRLILDHYFPFAEKDAQMDSLILCKINEEGLGGKDLIEAIQSLFIRFPKIEEGLVATAPKLPLDSSLLAAIALAVTNEKFWSAIKEEIRPELALLVERMREGGGKRSKGRKAGPRKDKIARPLSDVSGKGKGVKQNAKNS